MTTASYFVNTYNILDDETYEYWDYSKDDPQFDDCENDLVSFEIPFEVNEYICKCNRKNSRS